MACSRSPPPSPRAPKIQQQSWDDCGTPPIELYDPNKPHPSPIQSPKPRTTAMDMSPKSMRNLDHSVSSLKSPKSPRKFTYTSTGCGPSPNEYKYNSMEDPQRSPKIVYSTPSSNRDSTSGIGGDECLIHSNNTTPSSGYFEQSRSPQFSTYDHHSPRKSPKSPRKFIFDAVSPRRDSLGTNAEFYSYEPNVPETDNYDLCQLNSPINLRHAKKAKKIVRQSSLHHQQHHQQAEQQTKSHHETKPHPNFDLINQSSQQKQLDLFTDSPLISDRQYTHHQHHHQHHPQHHHHHHHHQQQQQQQQPPPEQQQHTPPIPAELSSEASAATTAICCDSATTDSNRSRDRRRDAINIISNPGYQVLHTSHSTLDRTCSDSVVSLRYRKSTSDLTNVTGNNSTPVVTAHHKRRGSSKGNLAYLASRRNSRDSMKSAASNASLFSNEEIGPLAFQASARGRQRRTSNFLELPVPDHVRPRVCSLPERPYNPRQSDDLYRLRTFSISKGTVVNCGDSIISRRSRSNTSVNSTTSRASERSPFEGSCCGGGYTTVDSLPSPTDSEPPPPPRYRVVMMGDAGTGKTALVSQFMTSEYMHTYDASLDDEFGEKTVSILLDGEESEMIFIDHPSSEMSVENSLSTYEPHSCVVVYSVVQRASFRHAEEIVKYLWRENVTKEKAVILVGNKADLARSRVIPTSEGKALAKSIDAKFIETSSGIQHNVDELLVGILKQIRLKETRDKKAAAHSALKMRSSKTHISLHLAKEILQKICLTDITKSKSCENLHVL